MSVVVITRELWWESMNDYNSDGEEKYIGNGRNVGDVFFNATQ
jgi:hypothetical protein